jgi:hypothetical protein
LHGTIIDIRPLHTDGEREGLPHHRPR